MLSLARSRYTHFVRLGLTATNVIGVLFGVAYKSKTPDLYPGSAHSAVGWIATGIAAAQISHLLVGPMTKLFNRVAGRDESKTGGYTLPPMRESFNSLRDHDGPAGLSRQGSFDVEATHVGMEDRDTSSDSPLYQEDPHEPGFTSENGTFYGESDHDPSPATSKIFSKPILTRTRKIILLMYNVMDRTILIVAFVAFCTGIATFWGLFVSPDAPRTTHVQESKINRRLAERKCHFQRHRPLDQRWRFLLARHLQSRSLVRVLCRNRMGKQDRYSMARLQAETFETLIRRMIPLRHGILDLVPRRGSSGCLLSL